MRGSTRIDFELDASARWNAPACNRIPEASCALEDVRARVVRRCDRKWFGTWNRRRHNVVAADCIALRD